MKQFLREAHAELAPIAIVLAIVPGELVPLETAASLQLAHPTLHKVAQRAMDPCGLPQNPEAQLPARLGKAHEEKGIEIRMVLDLGGDGPDQPVEDLFQSLARGVEDAIKATLVLGGIHRFATLDGDSDRE